MNWTLKEIEKLAEAGKIRGYKLSQPSVINLIQKYNQTEGKASIYGNKRTEVDGIKFQSKKEAKRYGELKLLLKAGKIGLLRLQVPYELNPGGTHSYKYIADFVYRLTDTGAEVVEDVKGWAGKPVYKKKKKLMLKVHGITIKET